MPKKGGFLTPKAIANRQKVRVAGPIWARGHVMSRRPPAEAPCAQYALTGLVVRRCSRLRSPLMHHPRPTAHLRPAAVIVAGQGAAEAAMVLPDVPEAMPRRERVQVPLHLRVAPAADGHLRQQLQQDHGRVLQQRASALLRCLQSCTRAHAWRGCCLPHCAVRRSCVGTHGTRAHMAWLTHNIAASVCRCRLPLHHARCCCCCCCAPQFEEEFLTLLNRRFGVRRVHCNIVYNEYISDKDHVHMTSTMWTTLTEFVKYLGREGKCVIDETEKVRCWGAAAAVLLLRCCWGAGACAGAVCLAGFCVPRGCTTRGGLCAPLNLCWRVPPVAAGMVHPVHRSRPQGTGSCGGAGQDAQARGQRGGAAATTHRQASRGSAGVGRVRAPATRARTGASLLRLVSRAP